MSAESLSSPNLVIIEKRRGGLPRIDFNEFWNYRELLFFLVWRDLKVRYKQTILGVVWAFIQPLLTIVMFTLAFSRWAKIPSDGVPYPLFAFLGVLAWNFFAGATKNSVNSITTSAALISKIYFPRILCPCAAVIATMADLLVALLLIIPLALRYHVPFSVEGLLIFSVCLGGIAFFSLGFGLWLGPINARFRDVAQVLPFAFQIWMYATPVIYPLGIVPKEYLWVVNLNPMVGYLEGIRSAILAKPLDTTALYYSFAVTAVLVLSGVVFFKKTESDVADYLG